MLHTCISEDLEMVKAWSSRVNNVDVNVDVSYPLDTLSWPLKVKVKPEGQGQISNNVFFRNSILLLFIVNY